MKTAERRKAMPKSPDLSKMIEVDYPHIRLNSAGMKFLNITSRNKSEHLLSIYSHETSCCGLGELCGWQFPLGPIDQSKTTKRNLLRLYGEALKRTVCVGAIHDDYGGVSSRYPTYMATVVVGWRERNGILHTSIFKAAGFKPLTTFYNPNSGNKVELFFKMNDNFEQN